DDREQTSYVSEIKLSPDAKFLYISNRGDDSIACFKVLQDGGLERVSLTPTGGKFPRHFALTPCGRGLIVANQDSGNIRYFERDIESGLLSDTGITRDVPAPCYIRFLD
ncbi:MAG: lactonase family protein, partial [Granulosicoccaceae bacterium]